MKQYKMDEEPTILIDANVLSDIQKYAYFAFEQYDSEIAGWAHYSKENGIYKLSPLQKQIASGAEVNAFPPFMNNIGYDISDMNVQWHSHVNMKAFWSQTDEENIRNTIKLTKFLISIVVNIFGEYKCRIDTISDTGRFGLDKEIQYTFNCALQIYSNNDVYRNKVISKLEKPKPKIIESTAPVNNYVQKNIPVGFNYKNEGGDSQINLFKPNNNDKKKSEVSEYAQFLITNQNKLTFISHSTDADGIYSEFYAIDNDKLLEWKDDFVEELWFDGNLVTKDFLVKNFGFVLD